MSECNCVRTHPEGHHWETCPQFDYLTMYTSREITDAIDEGNPVDQADKEDFGL